jgi:hypothetical protein
VVPIHHGIAQPIRFGLPGICFRLTTSLSRPLSAPFDPHTDRGHRRFHVFGLQGASPLHSRCMEQIKCHGKQRRRGRLGRLHEFGRFIRKYSELCVWSCQEGRAGRGLWKPFQVKEVKANDSSSSPEHEESIRNSPAFLREASNE